MAQIGNQNAVTHGGTCQALCLGRLPKRYRSVKKEVAGLGNALADAVVAARGQVDLTDQAVLQTILRAESHCKLCQKLLCETQNLDPDKAVSLSREIYKASSSRDKAITALGLGRRAKTTIKNLILQIHQNAGRLTTEHGAQRALPITLQELEPATPA
jgi:hypothetical protein